jgi:transcriptional regulator with GAF, ATPase, and Fis domain/CHASE2 domain-containing sensor protein
MYRNRREIDILVYLKKHTQILIQLIIVILSCLVLFSLSDFRKSIDEESEFFFIKARGELQPDSNIILIHFTSEDIARIGPWPIKRNYYALLINQLSKIGVKKIGIEVFLSSRFVTQSVYDNLLVKEIEKSGRVVLSSLAGKIVERDNNFFTDSLSYPSPKLLDEKVSTGHINFISDYDFEIPMVLLNDGINEKAFSLQISGVETTKKYLIVNFVSSWKKLKNYSAVEFAELFYKQSSELNKFRNKIVIIGISDSQIAPTFQTPFDAQMPGFALHAFALDNIFNSRDFNDKYYFLSLIIFPLLVIGFVFFKNQSGENIILKYISFGLIIVIITFTLSSIIFLKISTSFFLLPFIFLIISETIFYTLKGKEELKGALDETIVLRNLLLSKEKQLSELQKELNESGEVSSLLSNRIELLKNDIDKLKGNEEDRTNAEFITDNDIKEFYGIVYKSVSMEKVIGLIRKAAPTDATVLITGESGTGKELAAKAIHQLSKRKDKNFVTVNCSAITESLLESEMFGYVRGAFTGAVSDKQGRFELADGGTIFLDEIGETSENFQVKMLRVLQSGEIEKVGSTKSESVNVRVVAATNKNLAELVKAKKFREDLFYRLNVITIELPPLRERKEDINALAKSFLKAASEEIQISKAALEALNDYNWNGNVRELESVIKRAIIFAGSEKRKMIQLSDLPKELVKETTLSFEDIVIDSLRSKKFSHSSISETAKELGNINRTVIAENLRGVALRTMVENDFDLEKSVLLITGSQEQDTNSKLRTKIQTFIKNIEKDLKHLNTNDFDEVKKHLSAKYKNLPVKFHFSLDEVIKWKIRDGRK